MFSRFRTPRRQSCRYNPDPPRALPDALRPNNRIFNLVFIHPLPASPHRRWHVYQIPHFTLPLPDQGFGTDYQDWPFACKSNQERRQGQLKGFPQTDLVGQNKTGLARRALMRIKDKLHKVFLVLPQADFFSIYRRFDHNWSDIGRSLVLYVFGPLIHVSDQRPFRKPCQILNDKISQRYGILRTPQGVEFFLHPSYRVRRCVFPQKLVIHLPCRFRFISAAQETGF